jgi:MraZ protein
MSQFLGTHQNKLDGKGRVSIPAPFRASLRKPDGAFLAILRPSHRHACVEGWPLAAFETLDKPLGALPDFSDDQIDLAATIYADANELDIDKDGRVTLPAPLIAHAGLKDTVTFMGLGRMFQIWEPAAAEAFRNAARERQRLRNESQQIPSGKAA